MLGAIFVAEILFLRETLYPRNTMLSERRQSTAAAEKVLGLKPEVRRTKDLPSINIAPLPGMKRPKSKGHHDPVLQDHGAAP